MRPASGGRAQARGPRSTLGDLISRVLGRDRPPLRTSPGLPRRPGRSCVSRQLHGRPHTARASGWAHIMVCLARLRKTHTYPVWGMTTLRQFRSSGPMRAPCSRGLSLGHFMLNVYSVLFLCIPGTLAAPCLTCFGFQPGYPGRPQPPMHIGAGRRSFRRTPSNAAWLTVLGRAPQAASFIGSRASGCVTW